MNNQDLLHDFFLINSNSRVVVSTHAPRQRASPTVHSMDSEGSRQAAYEVARSISSTCGHSLSGSICLRSFSFVTR